ncbi:glmZ(sRNA)-inactivating NTPase [Moraxella macacae 0408225]|uniref:GlmZ(SRNA)-inactivating NTPase n=1 Tax=Moraxella macacae 0408225 TaxID=1230338 RepID=L2F8D2_9GAMM|nr:RNase adapter RapZ [Moraxella macacae]ELA09302.1 glmZ(sRNA)-inactivating NTPase [Moraxella macacae 0408225]
MTQILIVSGRSGSGKTSVLNILEDFGYYCLDNLPLSLVLTAVAKLADSDIKKIALGIDVRTPKADLSKFDDTFNELITQYGKDNLKIIYTTANENKLVARFDATYRVHPLMATGAAHNLPTAIKQEIELLHPIAKNADIKIDTSQLNIHELKEQIGNHLGVDNVVTVNLLSFGFKYGSPIDADFVFDVRVLPNPHWQVELREQTGLDADVQAFFAKYPEVNDMADDIGQFLIKWLPTFLHNNRHTLTIAIGCTGGKHRSVYVADFVATLLSNQLPDAMRVNIKHREKSRWQL